MVNKSRQVLVIFGPTASGKTGLAIELARELGGEIINADSRQVYKHMPVISACPTAEEYQKAPHHLFEFLDPRERFSAGRYALLAAKNAECILENGGIPVVVGGTGFYLRAFMEGMSQIPDIPREVEEALNKRETTALYADLLACDAALAARLDKNDRQRILRALSVQLYTGKKLSEWQAEGREGAAFDFVKVGLKPERKLLHERLEKRWKVDMVRAGVVEEVKKLRELGYSAEDPALKGLAIPDFFAHLEGKMDLDEVLQRAVYRDRQYAKRQYTWLNNTYGADVMLEKAEAGPVMAWMKDVAKGIRRGG